MWYSMYITTYLYNYSFLLLFDVITVLYHMLYTLVYMYSMHMHMYFFSISTLSKLEAEAQEAQSDLII